MKKLLLLLLITCCIKPMENIGTELAASAAIIGTSIGAATLYGIANAQFSAILCPEYFLQGGMRQMEERMPRSCIKDLLTRTKSPALKAFIWAPITSWHVGAKAGIFVALLSRLGTQATQLNASDLVKPLGIAMAATAITSFAYGALMAHKMQDPELLKNFKARNAQLMRGIPEQSEIGYVAASSNTGAGYRLAGLAQLGLVSFIIYKRLHA